MSAVLKALPCFLCLQELQVQCEAQVLLFVLDYVDSTQLEPAVAAQLFHHVRFINLLRRCAVYHPAVLPLGHHARELFFLLHALLIIIMILHAHLASCPTVASFWTLHLRVHSLDLFWILTAA